MCHFLQVHHLEWHFWLGQRSKHNNVNPCLIILYWICFNLFILCGDYCSLCSYFYIVFYISSFSYAFYFRWCFLLVIEYLVGYFVWWHINPCKLLNTKSFFLLSVTIYKGPMWLLITLLMIILYSFSISDLKIICYNNY